MKSKGKIQISIAQLDNYGPWTVTPGTKPEASLQVLQTRLFSDLEEEFYKRDGLAFMTRFDNTIAVTNGISLQEHAKIQKKIGENYPVTISFGIGTGESPYKAQELASQALQRTGSSQSAERFEELAGEPLSSLEESSVQIAHIDIDNATELTDNRPIYDTHYLIQKVYISLHDQFSKKGALVFYTGGDNFMAPCNHMNKDEILEAILEVEGGNGIDLKAGVGEAPKAEDAAFLASEGLHDIRGGKASEKVVFKSIDDDSKEIFKTVSSSGGQKSVN